MAERKNKAILVVCLLVASASVVYVVNRYQFRMKAFVWHVQHGNTTTVAGYRIAVPSGWWVDQSSADDARIWNTRTGESLWLHTLPKSPNFTLEYWSKIVETRMNSPENAITGRRDFSAAGEPFVCFERDYTLGLPAKMATPRVQNLHLSSIDCKSAGQLDIMFFGGMRKETRRDYSEFYSLMASLQKNGR